MDDQLDSAVRSRARPQMDGTFSGRSLHVCPSPAMVQCVVLCLEKENTSPLLTILYTAALPLGTSNPEKKQDSNKGIAKECFSYPVAMPFSPLQSYTNKRAIYSTTWWQKSIASIAIKWLLETSGFPFNPWESWAHAHCIIEGKLQNQKEQTYDPRDLENRLCCQTANKTFHNHFPGCKIK